MRYLLEVLQHNTDAVSVYRKISFEVIREFYYFRSKTELIRNGVKEIDPTFVLHPIDVNEYRPTIYGFWDFKPSWQNSFESINRSLEAFVCLGVFVGDRLVGYIVFEPAAGDVTQIAVDKPYRCKGIASLLFHRMLEVNRCNFVKILNTDIACGSMSDFLRSKKYRTNR